MASVTLQVGAQYAASTSVKAYPASNWAVSALPPSGSPVGSETATASVGSDGTLTFTGLSENTDYYAYASGGSPAYVRFRVDSVPGTSADPLLVESASVSKGNGKVAISGSTSIGSVPTGATKAIFRPDASMTMNDDGTAADANDYPLAANVDWVYDGDRLSAVKFYGTGNVFVWWFA